MLNKGTEKNSFRTYFTFDDVLLLPGKSSVLPGEVSLASKLTKKIPLNIPLISAAMDTVTESGTAIALAQEGGIGAIHKNMSIEEQVFEVNKVKKSESGMIRDPITVSPEQPVREALRLMESYKISGVPVTRNGKVHGPLVGIVTNRDVRFLEDEGVPVSSLMTSENLISSPAGITREEAKKLLHKHKIEKLLVTDKDGNLLGLITTKDIERVRKFPNSNRDDLGRLRVGAAIGVGPDSMDRVSALVEAHVDVLFLDSAHGHSTRVIDLLETIKKRYEDVCVIAGNVVTGEATRELIDKGADAVKVGTGPGSICTTRIISGVGAPQLSAIMDCVEVAHKYGVPIIGDGGVQYSGDIVKALVGGASSVMLGGLFAGTQEAPGESVLYHGRSYKVYRGMGSLEAMKKGSKDRYAQENVIESKLVPEGIEGRVPYRGTLSAVVHQLVGGICVGMGYLGAASIDELQQKKENFIQVSPASLRESHPHDVDITKEAPNYLVNS